MSNQCNHQKFTETIDSLWPIVYGVAAHHYLITGIAVKMHYLGKFFLPLA